LAGFKVFLFVTGVEQLDYGSPEYGFLMFIVLGIHLASLIFGLMVFIVFIRNISFSFFRCFSCSHLSLLCLGLQLQVYEIERIVLQLTDGLVISLNPFFYLCVFHFK